MSIILAISAGHYSIKKGRNIIRDRIRYLNYGILGLATIVRHQGNTNIKVYQADNLSVNQLFMKIEESGIDIVEDCSYFFLSIPSYYSISWCIDFCLKNELTYHKPVIVGGRWVVNNRTGWVKEKLKYVDKIIEGFGERRIAEYLRFPRWDCIADGSTKCFDWLDYNLLYEYQHYQPCIEISRGCGSGCQFCADKGNPRLRNKPVDIINEELDKIDSLYDRCSVYFEAPHFSFERKWLKELCQSLQKRKRQYDWRCTSRVESVPVEALDMMRESGLKVLDIGLESASRQQLLNMHKTANPERYLEKAEKLLVECQKCGIWVKLNLLLYAGETYETIQETLNWLTVRKAIIKDVSASNLVYYYNMDCIDDLIALGASIPEGQHIEDKGYIDLNLSPEISSKIAKYYSVMIPKQIATQRDFYDIKAVSYFERDYSYADFIQDLNKCNLEEMPFSFIEDNVSEQNIGLNCNDRI